MDYSLAGKARERGLVDLHIHDLRDFADDRSRQVDDLPYGGGPGMVIAAPPVIRALEHVRNVGPRTNTPYVLLMTPQGTPLTQPILERLAQKDWLTFLCGRYEGIDERVVELGLVQEEISIGDYVLGGGELPAMVLLEGILRLIPDVVGNRDSIDEDSFTSGLLDCPHYTRPEEVMEIRVPEVLRSGDSAAIARWRRRQSVVRTLRRRPDLLLTARLTEEDREFLETLNEESPGL